MPSYKPEVEADSFGTWAGNGCAFAALAEAEAYLRDLAWRWTAIHHTRIVESPDPVTCRLDPAGKLEWLAPAGKLEWRPCQYVEQPEKLP
jgi:hypothetical protein